MRQKIQFDNSRARAYRKCIEVLAFQSKDSVTFTKSWGVQNLRAGSWIIVPLSEHNEVTSDIYGCDEKVFVETYEPSPSLRPNRYRKKEMVNAYQPGNAFEIDTVLRDGHVEVKEAGTDAYDAWIVRAPSGEVYLIEDVDFRSRYVEVLDRTSGYRIKTRDEHWAADGTPKRVLALDGGGVRGIITIAYLEHLEELLRSRHGGSTDFRLSHYFDLIAGTSTGAIIAACLAKGMKVAEVRTKYESLAGSVFSRSLFRQGLLRARYSAKQLRNHLEDVFKGNTMGSTSIQTGLLVVAKRLDTGSTWPMSNNPKNRFFKAGLGDFFLSNEDYPLRTVVRASTAAPMFFAPELIEISNKKEKPHGEFVDGGVSAHNNPALLALQLVLMKGFGVKWLLDPDKLLLVSVGTGAAKSGVSKSWVAGTHAVKSLLSLMNDCTESVETILQWLSTSPTARHIDTAIQDLSEDLLAERPLIHYLRYNVHLNRNWISENLGRDIPEEEIKVLQRMDQPENMALLYELSVVAAKRQVVDVHFPIGFDLGR